MDRWQISAQENKEQNKSTYPRRGVLKLAGLGIVSGSTVGTAAAEEKSGERSGTKYQGGGSISSAAELGEAITTDNFWTLVENVEFLGKFAQGEVLPQSQSFGDFPVQGDQFGIISSGVAEDAADPYGDTSTYFATNPSNNSLIPKSPDGYDVNDPAAIRLTFAVPSDAEKVEFTYAFATEEIPTWVGSSFQDFFTAELELPDGTVQNVATLPDGNPVTVDNVRKYVSSSNETSLNRVTETFVNEIDVSSYQGEQLSLTFGVADVSDSSLNSAAFLDGVSLGDTQYSQTLTDLIGQKQGLIDDIQGAAGATLGEHEARNRTEQEAISLLNDIESDSLDAEIQQYTEAVHRMIATEQVSISATNVTTGDGNAVEKTVNNLYEFVTGAAIELLPEAAEGIVGSIARSIADDVAGLLDEMAGSMSGVGIMPDDTIESVYSLLDDLKETQASTAQEWVENNPKEAEEAVTSEGGQIANSAISSLKKEEASITGQLEDLFFEGYYFTPSAPEIELPDLDQFELDFSYNYDVPNENLPWYLQDVPPDEVTIDFDDIDWALPEAPQLSNLDDLLEQLQDAGSPAGVNETLDKRMSYLRDNVDSLESQDADTRNEISQLLSGAITSAKGVVDGIVDLLEEIGSLAETISQGLAIGIVLCVVGAAISSVTGIGSVAFLAIAGTLAAWAGYLGLMTVAINGIQVYTGAGYLATTDYIHHVGTYPLIETDLSEVQL